MCHRFSFVIALTEINKVNDFRVPRDSQVKYKFIFLSTLSSASPSWVLKLPITFPCRHCSRLYLSRIGLVSNEQRATSVPAVDDN